jgi:uncharacterized protein (TIGR00730 family)
MGILLAPDEALEEYRMSDFIHPNAHAFAYKNDAFLDSTAARPVRILSEYLGPLNAFQRERIHDTIVFMGSARLREDGPLGRYYAEARELARLVSDWSQSLPSDCHRFTVCSGGGPGIMEAANRGAHDAGKRSIALNISLPHEQRPNAYVTPELCFEFHYFFMRKLWFAHLARAVVIFPGGFGTMDEFMEVLTLAQTRKLDRNIFILLYGSSYWNEIVNFQGLVRHGMISGQDLDLLHFADDPATALSLLKDGVDRTEETTTPAFASSVTSCCEKPKCVKDDFGRF